MSGGTGEGLPAAKPPLQVRRFLIRLGLLIVVVWGCPVSFLVLPYFARYSIEPVFIPIVVYGAICHLAGRWVGRFEKDSPRHYGVGCSWAYLIGGGILVFIEPRMGAATLGVAVLLFVVGYRSARSSFGRRARLLTEGKCLFCEYDLAGLRPSGKCPECGQGFERTRLPADLTP